MEKKWKKGSDSPRKDTFDPVLVEGKTPETVVLLLSSKEEDILIKACEAIHTFGEKGDENKVHLLGLGALEPLCQLITHNNKLVRRNAFIALGVMATNSDVKNALKKMDAIPSIIDKLSLEEDVVVHEFATLCLAALSVDFACKVQISDNKGFPPLIQLLSSPDPDVQKNSLEVIFNLVQDYQGRVEVQELGGIPLLLRLLKSDYPVIQHLVLRILHRVTFNEDSCKTFREEQGFEKMMDILSNTEFSDLHADALQVVSNCVSDSESLHLIQKSGGLRRLMDFVPSPNSSEIQSSALKCITGIARSSENRKLLHEQNIEKVLVELLSVLDVIMKTSICQAVSAMSLHPASKDSFRELGVIPAVVQLLNEESLILKEAATQVLYSLTDCNQLNTHAVYEAGGHELLVQQLCGSCPRTVANSAATLGNMAKQEVIRCSILSHGAIQALVELLKSTNTQILVSATHCLTQMTCDNEAREQLNSAEGLQPLVNLLHSYHKEVLHNACRVINICASDRTAAVEMCRFGALEMLQEINQSVNQRSSLSELVMSNLLNSNLSIKYSLTGFLSSTDNISDDFYDAGKARKDQRVLTLEELSQQPVNQHHPVIVVNITSMPEEMEVVPVEQSKPEEKNISRTDSRALRKQKKKSRQEEETKPEPIPEPKPPTEQPQKMTGDVSLQLLAQKARESILLLADEREQYATLARLVSTAMGGPIKVEKLHEFPWVLHISKLKFKLQSNVVPIGAIKMGIYCHRALLFKCLADSIGLSCTLVRGDYNRAWNEVFLSNGNLSRKESCCYIVDLMHHPGSLLKANSLAAEHYQTI